MQAPLVMAAAISSVEMQLLLVVTCMVTLVSLNTIESEPMITPPRPLDHKMHIQGLQECQGSFVGIMGCLQEILKIFYEGGGIPGFGGDAGGLGGGGGGDDQEGDEGEGGKGGDTGGIGEGGGGDDQEGDRGEGEKRGTGRLGGDPKEGDRKQREDEGVRLTDFGGGQPGIGGGQPGFGGGIPWIGGGMPGIGRGLISPACCKAISEISDSCWPVLFPLFPNPPKIIDTFCAPLSV